jgi:hypothetical protein
MRHALETLDQLDVSRAKVELTQIKDTMISASNFDLKVL